MASPTCGIPGDGQRDETTNIVYGGKPLKSRQQGESGSPARGAQSAFIEINFLLVKKSPPGLYRVRPPPLRRGSN